MKGSRVCWIISSSVVVYLGAKKKDLSTTYRVGIFYSFPSFLGKRKIPFWYFLLCLFLDELTLQTATLSLRLFLYLFSTFSYTLNLTYQYIYLLHGCAYVYIRVCAFIQLSVNLEFSLLIILFRFFHVLFKLFQKQLQRYLNVRTLVLTDASDKT